MLADCKLGAMSISSIIALIVLTRKSSMHTVIAASGCHLSAGAHACRLLKFENATLLEGLKTNESTHNHILVSTSMLIPTFRSRLTHLHREIINHRISI